MRRERQMCMTSFDVGSYDIEDDYENNTTSITDTRTIKFFMKMSPLTHQNIYETNKHNACFLTNYDGKIIYCNDLWYNTFGYMEYEVMYKTPKILHGEFTDKDICINYTKNLYENDVSNMKVLNYDKYGNSYNVFVRQKE